MNGHSKGPTVTAAARDLLDDIVENSLFRAAVVPGKNGRINVTACIFWLRNRRPDRWRDKPEIVRPKPMPPDLSRLTDAELEQFEEIARKIEPQEAGQVIERGYLHNLSSERSI